MSGRIKRTDKIERCIIPVIGNIKVGQKNEKGLPESLDYFTATGDYAHLFKDEFGDKPTSIEIVFLSDSLEDVCNERLEIRKGKKLFASGDGQLFNVWSEKEGKRVLFSIDDYPDIMEMCEKKAGAKWYSVLTLRFIIPRVCKVLGVWQFTTRGEASSIPQIVGPFDKVREIYGTVSRVVFDLKVEKVTSQTPGSKSVFPVVKLLPRINEQSVRQIVDRTENLQIEGGE